MCDGRGVTKRESQVEHRSSSFVIHFTHNEVLKYTVSVKIDNKITIIFNSYLLPVVFFFVMCLCAVFDLFTRKLLREIKYIHNCVYVPKAQVPFLVLGDVLLMYFCKLFCRNIC